MGATSESDRFVSLGIDYITCTTRERGFKSSLIGFANWILNEQCQKGHERKNYRASGYRGWMSGGCAFGCSPQGGLVRLSSDCACEHWEQLAGFADNISRVDVQATFVPSNGTQARLRQHHRELKTANAKRGRPAAFSVRYGPNGPESMTLGKRISDRFGRVYDKGLESGLPQYAGALRYELELHRQLARDSIVQLMQSPCQPYHIGFMVATFMSDRRLVVPEFTVFQDKPRPATIWLKERPSAGDSDTILQEWARWGTWMRVQVKPSVEKLINAGRLEIVLESLGLCGHVLPLPNGPCFSKSDSESEEERWQ